MVSSIDGNTESIINRASILEQLSARDKAAQRKIIGFHWRMANGAAVHSTITPIGGFKVAGFMEIITDPTQALNGIDEMMGGQFSLESIDGELLYPPQMIETEQPVDNEEKPETDKEEKSENS